MSVAWGKSEIRDQRVLRAIKQVLFDFRNNAYLWMGDYKDGGSEK